MRNRTLMEVRQESPESVVRTYFRRWNAHDVEGMMALLDDGIVFSLEDSGIGAMRQGLSSYAWAMAAGLRVSIVELDAVEENVRVVFDEQTRVDELLGVGSCRREMEFTVRDGIIRQATWIESRGHDGVTFLTRRREALKPFIEWVEATHPQEARRLFWHGKLNSRGQTLAGRVRRGRRVVELLERYQRSHP